MAVATDTRTIRRKGGLLSIFGLHGLAAKEAALGYAIVGLVYLFLLGFVFLPMLLAFYVSTTRWDALSPLSQAKFVGLDNYTDLVTDSRFRLSIWKDFEWSFKAYVGQIGLGLLLAIVVTNITRFRSLARFISFAPFILPTVATAILFTILMDPTWGIFNQTLRLAHLPDSKWLADPGTAMNSALLMIIWKYAGYYMVLFMTALLAVPQEYYDAAHIDGAGPVQTFFKITWPLIRPAFLFISVINVIGNLQVFDTIFVMTGGGPNRATEVVVLLMYNTAFTNFRYSQANAMAVILFFIILALTVFQMKVLKSDDTA
jgi:ABC-type sugar transport system permease subunit